MTAFISNIIGFTEALKEQNEALSSQSLHLMAASTKSINSTFVADPDAGTKQIPSEDAHPNQVKDLKKNIVLNLSKVLSEELSAIGEKDYNEISILIDKLKSLHSSNSNFMKSAKEQISQSRGQFADVIQTNSVYMESGNTVDVLSSNEIKVLKSLLLRAGTAIRTEAPVLTDTAHSRILLAHTLLGEADLMIHKARNMLQSVKEEFGLSAKDIGLIAQNNLSLSADRVNIAGNSKVVVSSARIDLNPETDPAPHVESHLNGDSLWEKSKLKKTIQLPQWTE